MTAEEGRGEEEEDQCLVNATNGTIESRGRGEGVTVRLTPD
jgi:hypothetical protein